MKRAVFVAVLVGLVMFAVPGLYADSVFIGLGANGGAPGLVAAGSGSANLAPSLILGWTVSATAFGSPLAGPEPNLEGFTVDASDTTGGISSLQIYVTETGLSSPTGISTFLSGLTSNVFLGGITSVTESTYVDTGNGLFTTTSPLSSFVFTGIGSTTLSATTPSLGPLYSETEVFNIAASGIGTVQDTITISNSSVPEPGTLTMFGSGLIGLAGFLRRKLAVA